MSDFVRLSVHFPVFLTGLKRNIAPVGRDARRATQSRETQEKARLAGIKPCFGCIPLIGVQHERRGIKDMKTSAFRLFQLLRLRFIYLVYPATAPVFILSFSRRGPLPDGCRLRGEAAAPGGAEAIRGEVAAFA